MKNHLPLIVATFLMLLVHDVASCLPLERLLQIPSGYIAAFFMGAPASFNGEVIEVALNPLLTVSVPCSGRTLFSILIGLGGGYWCGSHWLRWLALFPCSYFITLLSNSSRIVAAYHFRVFTTSLFPEWLQEFAHMGVGGAWSLTVVSVLVYLMNRSVQPKEEPCR